jgi:pimeloyl-ACP methyl ester carboxylesterase
MRRVENRVLMVPATTRIEGRQWHYAVSDNEPVGRRPVWALNVHGFFAAGSMYWRESARLAGGLGWRVVNPSLPGFGGSDPLPWEKLNLRSFSRGLAKLLDALDVERVVVLGHSMGGAIAMQFAHDHPDRTLGVIYRDGVATPGWKTRTGPLYRVLSPVSPDLGMLLEFMAAAAMDIPDLLYGRALATVKGLVPGARVNIRSVNQTVPVGAMLFASDLTAQVKAVVARGDVPILPVWGRLDRITPPSTAKEFGDATGLSPVWVTGGHSWMLARPGTQLHILRTSEEGVAFRRAVERRARPLRVASARVEGRAAAG